MANQNHFELTLDTLAPQGSISRGTTLYTNEQIPITINSTSDDGLLMKVWFDAKASGAKTDAGYTGGEWTAISNSITSNFTANGTFYYHLVLMDAVGNESEVYNTEKIVYDTAAPVISSVVINDGDDYTTSKTGNTVVVEVTDSLSGVKSVTISGEGVVSQTVTAGTEGKYTFTEVEFTGDDRTVTVKANAVDNAGNAATENSDSIKLDTTAAEVTIVLKKDTTAISEKYVNYKEMSASLTFSADVVGYKVWEEGSVEPESYTQCEKGTTSANVDVTIGNSEGKHTIKAQVIDAAGIPSAVSSDFVILDTVKPTVTVALDKDIISAQSGYNSINATVTSGDAVTVDNAVASFTVYINGEVKTSGNGAPAASYSYTNADFKEGTNTVKVEVVDKAGNKAEASDTFILDLTAPTLKLVLPDGFEGTDGNVWYNANLFNNQLKVSEITEANSISNLKSMNVWTSASATDTTIPANATAITTFTGTEITVTNAQISGSLTEGLQYVHAVIEDKVGNKGYAHAEFRRDTVKPNELQAAFALKHYGSQTAQIGVTSVVDPTPGSGIAKVIVSGDIVDSPKEFTAYETIAVTLTSGDGVKNVTLKAVDCVGNESDVLKTISTELDTSKPTATLTLLEPNGASKGNPSSVAEFKVKIEVSDDALQNGGFEYQLWGDFSKGSQGSTATAKPTEWAKFVIDSGASKPIMTISGLFCTSNPAGSVDGVTKTVNVLIKDAAGNVTPATITTSFVYDTSAPVVTVTQPDYNRISLVETKRRNTSGEIAGMNNEINFTFKVDSAFTEYQVCAYVDRAAAEAGDQTKGKIGIANGSSNMAGEGTFAAKQSISCKITGADYKAVVEEDGAHIVVVYAKDAAGTWSVAAQFEA